MHIYNRTYVLLSTPFYMFRQLLCHLQGELSHLSKLLLLLLVYYRYNYYMKNTQNGKPY